MKIGIFDSGYGGLTILEQIRQVLPEYDYIYLGDNARAPYGSHSFEVIYQYTWQAVEYLLSHDCALIILACNTASAKALRSIQQRNLPALREGKEVPNVLGVIRPTVEQVVHLTQNGHIGILGTQGTVDSESYPLEIAKQTDYQGLNYHKQYFVSQQACPMWVPLIEAGEHKNAGADYFVDKYLSGLFCKDPKVDTIILGCTHYPLLKEKIEEWLQRNISKDHKVTIIPQGEIVAQSLQDYLKRHNTMRKQLSQNKQCRYLTTESAAKFEESAGLFLSTSVVAEHIDMVEE